MHLKLLQFSCYPETTKFGEYLGVSLSGRTLKRNDYHDLIEQFSSKLASWKARNLSMEDRITLTKSVFEAIPIYPTIANIIPKACIKDIQELQRNFAWGIHM